MKLVTAIIKPYRLAEVKDALAEVGFPSMTVTEVKGCGRQRGHTELYRGSEYQVDFVPKLRVEVAVDDADVEDVLTALCDAARTDSIGDGKIFVLELVDALRIRTGERGLAAL
jgi:nitrogen regulatory protein P-II 1/nitrogen regulatory protein P-II 2